MAGAPVYRKGDGKVLSRIDYDDRLWTWEANTEYDGQILGGGHIKSVGTALCPADIQQWQYWDAPEQRLRSGDISVKCIDGMAAALCLGDNNCS